ncbi:MAG: ZIP family metal transporter [Clostridiales bacterium]|nr:ZIP family metal transporter [Clostridiales bacterium]
MQNALLIAFLSGVLGTGAGGALGALFPQMRPGIFRRAEAVTAGLMLAVVCFEMLPEAVALHTPLGLSGIFAGVALMACLSPLTGRLGGLGGKLGAGVALHNLPEGMAIGAGLAAPGLTGLRIALSIALHDVPEGAAIALPLRAEGKRVPAAIGAATLSGLPTVAGALAGMLLGRVGDGLMSFCLGLAGGAMLELTCRDMLPDSRSDGSWLLAGLLLGGGVRLLLG